MRGGPGRKASPLLRGPLSLKRPVLQPAVALYEAIDAGMVDAATLLDALSNLTAQLTLSDTAAATDTLATLQAALALTDTATGADALSTIQAALALTDTGAAVDALQTLMAALSLSDTATGADALSTIKAALALTDTATGADALSTIQAALALPLTPVKTDDADASWTYSGGGWNAQTGHPLAYLGTYHYSTAAVAIASRSVTGPTVASLGFPKADDGTTSIQVFLDGVLMDTFSEFDAGGGWGFESTGVTIPAGVHTLEYRNNSTGIIYVDYLVATVTEGGTMADAISAIQAALSLPDTATSADAITTIAAALTLTDQAVVADQVAALQAALTLTDAAAVAEAIAIVSLEIKTFTESASVTEQLDKVVEDVEYKVWHGVTPVTGMGPAMSFERWLDELQAKRKKEEEERLAAEREAAQRAALAKYAEDQRVAAYALNVGSLLYYVKTGRLTKAQFLATVAKEQHRWARIA